MLDIKKPSEGRSVEVRITDSQQETIEANNAENITIETGDESLRRNLISDMKPRETFSEVKEEAHDLDSVTVSSLERSTRKGQEKKVSFMPVEKDLINDQEAASGRNTVAQDGEAKFKITRSSRVGASFARVQSTTLVNQPTSNASLPDAEESIDDNARQ